MPLRSGSTWGYEGRLRHLDRQSGRRGNPGSAPSRSTKPRRPSDGTVEGAPGQKRRTSALLTALAASPRSECCGTETMPSCLARARCSRDEERNAQPGFAQDRRGELGKPRRIVAQPLLVPEPGANPLIPFRMRLDAAKSSETPQGGHPLLGLAVGRTRDAKDLP